MLKTAKLYIQIFIVFTILTIVLFKFGFLSFILLFYRGIILIFIVLILTISGFIYLHYKKNIWRIESIISATIIAFLLHIAFFITVPVTLDRSISIFLLNDINNHEQGLTKQELTDDFTSKYIYNDDAIGRRIFEQTTSKNISVSNEIVKIDNQGQYFLKIMNFVKNIYGI